MYFMEKKMIINFNVIYTRKEYLSIVTDFALADIREQSKKKNPEKKITSNFWFVKKLIRFVGSIVFYKKKRKLPYCEFTFSPENFTRKTVFGTEEMEWSDILIIREFSEGMIIFMKDGAMPIPYRCISEEEKHWIIETQEQG